MRDSYAIHLSNTPLPKNTLTTHLSNVRTRVGRKSIRPTTIPQGMNTNTINPQMIVRFCWE